MRLAARARSHSSKRSGRLSSAEGSRKPYSTSVSLRARSPRYIAPICGTVTWLSSSDQQEVLREVVEERVGRLARRRGRRASASSSRRRGRSPSARASRGRRACAARGAAPRAACSRAAKLGEPLLQLAADALRSRASGSSLGRDVVARRVDHRALRPREHLAAQRVDLGDRRRSRRRRTRCGARARSRTAGRPRPRRRARGRCRGGSRRRCARTACRRAGAAGRRAPRRCARLDVGVHRAVGARARRGRRCRRRSRRRARRGASAASGSPSGAACRSRR